MADETEKKLSFKNADELTTFLMDLQGQLINMQETVDKLSPVKEEESDEGEPTSEELTDEELSEIDRLLQEN